MKNKHPTCPECKTENTNAWICTKCGGSGQDGCGNDIFECDYCNGTGYEFAEKDKGEWLCSVCGYDFTF